MGYIRINRFGRVSMNGKTSTNQCKEVGHDLYDYKVQITVHDKYIDKVSGFVIDHQEIAMTVLNAFDYGATSCENLVGRIARLVENALSRISIKAEQIHVTIKPVPVTPTKDFAFIEWSSDINF